MLRAFFVRLSENKELRKFAEQSSLGRRLSGRFVAGTDIADAVRATQSVNRGGMSVSIDNLGENVTNPAEARQSAQLYHQILDAIVANYLNANISLKLTHMGLDIDERLARELVSGLVAKAASMDPPGFVRVDMEGSPYTQRTIDFVHELHHMPGNANSVGTVIQAYLRRSEKDVEDLLADGIRIRLCKGAYKEPAELAFPAKSEVDANYVKLAEILMKSGIYHGMATHDENIIREIEAFATREKLAPETFEFQMLYGIRRDLQQEMVRKGWRVRVYIPFGTEWYPYFMRRLGERPANVLFIARNLLRS
jgi:proline dehydrogenase